MQAGKKAGNICLHFLRLAVATCCSDYTPLAPDSSSIDHKGRTHISHRGRKTAGETRASKTTTRFTQLYRGRTPRLEAVVCRGEIFTSAPFAGSGTHHAFDNLSKKIPRTLRAYV